METANTWERIVIPNGEQFFSVGEDVNKVFLLISGKVAARNRYAKFTLESGSAIGIMDIYAGKYLFDYEAATELTVLAFHYSGNGNAKSMLNIGVNYQELIVNSMFMQYKNMYNLFQDKFAEFVNELNNIEGTDKYSIDQEMCDYMMEMASIDKTVFHSLFTSGVNIVYHNLKAGCSIITNLDIIINKILDTFNESMFDLDLDDNDEEEAISDEKETEEVETEESETEESESDDKDEAGGVISRDNYDFDLVKSETKDSLKKILDYSELEAPAAVKFRMLLENYESLPDRNSTDNGVRELRKRISDSFYDIYERVFLKSRKEEKIDRVIEMFLTYGFMDEREFDDEYLADLYYFKPNFESEKCNIFTIYDWLCAIYEGKREPSKDEYDCDYKEKLREIKKNQQVTKAEEMQYLNDQDAKVKFEINNIFRVTNRITSGEVTVFCPVLSQKKFVKEIKDMFLSVSKLEASIDSILDIDYSLFHREQMYYDAENKIDNIVIMKQVMPDILLLPNVGSKGIMWQDISEKKRDTSARFVLPQFLIGDLDNIMVYLAGVFRWEMCRTVQGNYWNDVREHSLTSEYCDYVQFFRKNKDLSEETKEKIKMQYKNCRNSYRDMFVKDYEAWIKYEAKGALRLNKVNRKILYMYCPASAKYRSKLEKQPVYSEASASFNRERLHKVKELKGFNANVLKRNGTITPVLEENLKFYEEL